MATPGNSNYNELVIEAARESILHGGKVVEIRNDSRDRETKSSLGGQASPHDGSVANSHRPI
jgi:hypothetical protein